MNSKSNNMQQSPSTMVDASNPSVYVRGPRGFREVLVKDVADWSGVFKSLKLVIPGASGVFVSGSPQDIASWIYMEQALEGALLVLFETRNVLEKTIANSEEFGSWIANQKFNCSASHLLHAGLRYRIDIACAGSCALPQELREPLIPFVGTLIKNWTDQSGIELCLDLRNPDIRFVLLFDQEQGALPQCLLGIDLIGFDASKRVYKITNAGASIKGTVAYSLMRQLSIKAHEIILDPHAGTGEVCVEAGLYATRVSPWRFEKDHRTFAWQHLLPFSAVQTEVLAKLDDTLICKHPRFVIRCVSPHFGHIATTRRHAKIAGVEGALSFSRIEQHWLDAKFKKGEVDGVVSYLPLTSAHKSPAQIKKEMSMLFYQLEFLVKPRGKIILMLHDLQIIEEPAAAYGFVLNKDVPAWLGAKQVHVLEYIAPESVKKKLKDEDQDK
jgi:hypothetical protein